MNDSLEDYLHFISDVPKVQDKSNPTKESVLLTLQKKKECEVRAMKTLEFLIEGKIRPEVFLRCINHLNRSYYSDVIEERSITKLCGYCLCDNKIPTMTKKQFAIDSKNNKVYDVTNRKKYCSDYCYKASIHIEKQIDDSPLWLRNSKDVPKYTLLPTTDRGIPGDDLGSEPIVPKEEIPFESAYSFTEASLQELTHEKSEKVKETPKPEISVKIIENLVTKEEEAKSSDEAVKPTPVYQKVKKDIKVKRKNKIQLLKQYILEWLTVDTYVFLFGEQRVKECLNELDLSGISDVSVFQQKELVQLCKRLNLADEKILDTQLKSVPSYKQIKKENKEVNAKVRSFYSGSAFKVKEKIDNKHDTTPVPEDIPPDVVPIGDPPNVIRQNVFLNSIKNAMKILSGNLGISWVLVLKELEALVKTFSLQPHSVVFQPVEWNLIALVLIKMLSFHDATIKEQMSTTKSQTFINSSISSFPGIQTMLNELFAKVEDVKSFLNGYLCVKSTS